MIDRNIKKDLQDLGALEDGKISLAGGALLLAAASRKSQSLERYHNKLSKMSKAVSARYEALIKEGAEDDAATRLAALKHVVAHEEGYEPVSNRLGNIFNADLIQAMDTGKAIPIILCIIYAHLAKAQGWDAHILNPPGVFVMRLDLGAERLMFDPSDECRLLQAHDVRELVKQAAGNNAELSAHYFEPVAYRDVLVGIQNNIKLRQIEVEDYHAALDTVTMIRWIAPNEKRILLDAGILYARTQQHEEAIEALEAYLPYAPTPRDRHEAALLLQDIRNLL